MRIYEVGGSVRDSLLGKKSKDIDYVVTDATYADMWEYVKENGTIFLEKPEFLTIRAKVNSVVADFVLARKDGSYSDNRRPDSVEAGTLFEDLSRRDLTINAIARSALTGEIIDPYNGVYDIEHGWIRAVGNAKDRFNEDHLRVLRAIRFAVVLDFDFWYTTSDAIFMFMRTTGLRGVNPDRIREELNKAFSHNTTKTLDMLNRFSLDSVLFDRTLRLEVKQSA